VVTKPFQFEGNKRRKQAEQVLVELKAAVDTLITIPNQRLLTLSSEPMPLLETFKRADEVLLNAVQGISDLIQYHGYINVDFADVKTIMSDKGLALMGTGRASGEKRALVAMQQAIASPLLEEVTIDGATGLLINITGGRRSPSRCRCRSCGRRCRSRRLWPRRRHRPRRENEKRSPRWCRPRRARAPWPRPSRAARHHPGFRRTAACRSTRTSSTFPPSCGDRVRRRCHRPEGFFACGQKSRLKESKEVVVRSAGPYSIQGPALRLSGGKSKTLYATHCVNAFCNVSCLQRGHAMAQGTVRIEQAALDILRDIAREEDEALPAVLSRAVEAYRRMRFIERVNAGYAELRKDDRAWLKHKAELKGLEQTVADGLPPENWTNGRRARR